MTVRTLSSTTSHEFIMADRVARPAYFTKFDIIRHWSAVESDPFVFVLVEDRRFVVEAPECRTDLAGVMDIVKRIRVEADETLTAKEKEEQMPPREAVLRVFTDYEHACMYLELMQGIYGPEFPMEVVTAPVDGLFSLREDVSEASHAENEAPVRFDLSVMRTDDEWPSVIDTLWAETTNYN